MKLIVIKDEHGRLLQNILVADKCSVRTYYDVRDERLTEVLLSDTDTVSTFGMDKSIPIYQQS